MKDFGLVAGLFVVIFLHFVAGFEHISPLPHIHAQQKVGNLPPYTNPGSWIGCMAGFDSFNSTTDTLYIALWDGATGQNYTRIIAEGFTFMSFIPTMSESVIAMSYNPLSVYNQTTVATFTYSPNKAPAMSGKPCIMPVYASQAYPFIFKSVMYALVGNILYQVGKPTSGDTCDLTVLQPLPTAYSPFCTLSITEDRISYVAGTTLVELWVTEDNFTITSQPLPQSLYGVWLVLQEDSATGDYYYFVTTQNYDVSFWQGTRKNQNNKEETVKWTSMQYWKGLDPGSFTIDNRNESAYGGPLFCSTDSLNDAACYTVQSQNAWNGARLKPAFNYDSGPVTFPVYDPNCHN